MPIIFDRDSLTFHLQAGDSSYIFKVYREGYLVHLYWGRKIRSHDLSRLIPYGRKPLSPTPDPLDEGFSLDTVPQEYPASAIAISAPRPIKYSWRTVLPSPTCAIRGIGFLKVSRNCLAFPQPM